MGGDEKHGLPQEGRGKSPRPGHNSRVMTNNSQLKKYKSKTFTVFIIVSTKRIIVSNTYFSNSLF